jgi:hypothetical protein
MSYYYVTAEDRMRWGQTIAIAAVAAATGEGRPRSKVKGVSVCLLERTVLVEFDDCKDDVRFSFEELGVKDVTHL